MNKKKYLLLFKIKNILGRNIVILRMTEVWKLLLTKAQVTAALKLAPVLLFFWGNIFKPVGTRLAAVGYIFFKSTCFCIYLVPIFFKVGTK
ncbi:MAG: hypothetical protein EAZ85_07625 [Bacteroidetes bacterium]|nr:MAG: hypothetical protein EAZ85_07625 [Bacteroidota bacterium]